MEEFNNDDSQSELPSPADVQAFYDEGVVRVTISPQSNQRFAVFWTLAVLALVAIAFIVKGENMWALSVVGTIVSFGAYKGRWEQNAKIGKDAADKPAVARGHSDREGPT